MDFRLDADQQALQASVHDFCAKEVSSTVVRQAFESPDGDAPELYKKMAELGWLGVAVPEPLGGLGMGCVEQAVVCEQLGYVNAPGAYLSTACLTVPALVALGAADAIGPLLDGSKRATVVWDPSVVVDAGMADAFLVAEGDRAVFYDRSAAEVTSPLSLDGTRRLGSVVFTGSGTDLGSAETLRFRETPGPATSVDMSTALLCAEMVGGMRWALDTTVAYVKDRHQFGRPIGSFQAVQHRCADMLLQTESASSAAYYAAYAVAGGLHDAAYAASVAKAYCSDAALWVNGECIQLHGGIGFTWEHDAHLYFKRATTNRQLLGDASFHRDRVLRLDPTAAGD